MNFLIADTFTDSLARLTSDEQKLVKTTAFDLQIDPSSPGLSFHRLDKSKDKNFWSVRVNADVRIIVHRTSDALLLCYVDHHDKAYAWAERRKLETHPKTGASQLVEIRETVREVVVPKYTAAAPASVARRLPPLARVSDEELLSYGVPQDFLADVRQADEDSLLVLTERLPAEAAEAVLELATGGTPRVFFALAAAPTPYEHPDAQRRFRVIATADELQAALDAPWDKWAIFLHPEQRQLVERVYSGPARVAGSAGTGKTIVAVHRAVHLARTHRDARVLLATFSEPLAYVLTQKLRRLVGNEPRLAERIDVHSLDGLAVRLYQARFGPVKLASRADIKDAIHAASGEVSGHAFSPLFLLSEWEDVVDAWQVTTWDTYREVPRLGRKTRLPEAQRRVVWSIIEQVRSRLAERGLTTEAAIFNALAESVTRGGPVPYDFAVIDEAQDVSVSQLRFFAALGGERPNALFFAGDLGQRIFRQPFSWKSVGVDVRGRSRTLRVNYRTSHQIREHADRLLAPALTDLDGNQEERRGTVSAFNGPAPAISVYPSAARETAAVGEWLRAQVASGLQPHELAVFVRSEGQLARAEAAVRGAGLVCRVLDERVTAASGHVSVCTMHLAKGLEFRGVAVMACDDEIVPLQERIEAVGDDADLQEIYDTERHLLYVACTRARDQLSITGVEPASEFLDDLRATPSAAGARR